MTTTTRLDVSAAVAVLTAAALIIWTLIPFAPDQQAFPALELALIMTAAVFIALAVPLAIVSAVHGPRRLVPRRLEVAALWCACGVAVLSAAAAVAASAQSFNLERVALAQANTSLFVLSQPAAASIYLVAVALATQSPAVGALLGPPTRGRLVAELAMVSALAALGATLFLGGFSGTVLPGPVWVVVKTLAVGALLLFMRRRLSGIGAGPRMAIAWAAALVGLLNLAVTFVLVPR